MFITARVYLELCHTHNGNSSKSSVHKHARCDSRAAWSAGLGTQGDWQSWEPSVDGESFVLYFQPYVVYRTLFEGSGIHHSNSGLQITPDNYINELFMLVFDLTPDLAASEGHTSDQNLLHTSQLTSCNKKRLYQHLRRHQATNFEVSKFLKIQKSFGPPFLGSWGY